MGKYSIPTISGISTGIIFAYLGQGFENVSSILTTLVTVQGSFLAIVVSVFLLSSQVTASEFNPFALDELEDRSPIDGIIALFILSILVDILYIIAQSRPLVTIPTDWNLTLGVTVGLATICFLSVLPAKRSISESVDPEQMLQRAFNGVEWEGVNESVNMDIGSVEDEISLPQRSSLVVIEQILYSSNERDDESTLRQSIFYMHKSIIKLLSEDQMKDERDHSVIFGHWQRCIAVGKQGDKPRIILLSKAHSRIIVSLITENKTDSLNTRLRELEDIQLRAFEKASYQPEFLSWYQQFVTLSLESGGEDEIESILSSLLSVSLQVTMQDNEGQVMIPDLTGERRSIVSTCFSNSIECLTLIGEHEHGSQNLLRRISQNTIKSIDEAFQKIRGRITDSDLDETRVKSVEQNILSTTRESSLSAVRSLAEVDTQTSVNLAKVAIEISVHQDNPARQLWAELTGEDRNEIVIDVMSFTVQRLKYEGYVSAFSSLEEVSKEDVTDFADDLEALIEAERSDTG